MDVRERLAANMVRLRKEKGWSQEELGHQAGVHRTYVSGVERRVRNPTITLVAKVAAGLGCSIGALVDEDPSI
jgi:transcriptional regulator with XRE-family HTH domain